MPIYEYHCEKCQRDFEVEQRITDDPVKTCPRCRSRRVKRLISQTSFVLKGSGWYSDLYSSKQAAKSSEAADSKPESTSDAGSEKKSDSGPEKKSDAGSEKKSDGGSEKSSKGAAKKGKSGKAAA
jgi:putative FmdB family regulatory protein